MLLGSCLCKAIRYSIEGERPFKRITHCHCGMCRKQHGAAFATYGVAKRAAFALSDPHGALVEYRATPEVARSFCNRCGSSLFWSHEAHADFIDVALGTLDDDPGRPIDAHIYVSSKAGWHAISDALPQYEGTMPTAQKKDA